MADEFLDSVPKQKTKKYIPRPETDEEEEAAAPPRASKYLKLIQGEGEEKSKNENDEKVGFYNLPLGSGGEYLKRARALQYQNNPADFFDKEEKDLVFAFGVQSELLCRLGYDRTTKQYKYYVKKDNPGSPPTVSVLGILVSEMEDIIEYLHKMFEKIDKGEEEGKPYLKPIDMGEGIKIEQPKNLEFWTLNHESVYYTESSHSRWRTMWGFGSRYTFHGNVIHEPGDSSRYDNFYGPKIRMSRKEVTDFIELYNKIKVKMGGN